MLFVGTHGGGMPVPRGPLLDLLGHSDLVFFGGPTAYYLGEVAFGFDRVQVHSADERTVDAVVVDCAGHLSFNYYVAEVVGRVVGVTANGPDGRTAHRKQGQ